MEARVTALEGKFDKIDGRLAAIQSDLAAVKAKVDHLPTAFNVVQICGILIALVVATGGASLAIMKFLVTP